MKLIDLSEIDTVVKPLLKQMVVSSLSPEFQIVFVDVANQVSTRVYVPIVQVHENGR